MLGAGPGREVQSSRAVKKGLEVGHDNISRTKVKSPPVSTMGT
jgi:hypothetical protein